MAGESKIGEILDKANCLPLKSGCNLNSKNKSRP